MAKRRLSDRNGHERADLVSVAVRMSNGGRTVSGRHIQAFNAGGLGSGIAEISRGGTNG